MRRISILIVALCIGQSAFCDKTKVIDGIDSKLINISFESSDAVPNTKDANIYNFEWSVGDKVSLIYPKQDAMGNSEFSTTATGKTSKFEGGITPWVGSKSVYSIFPYNKAYIITGADKIKTATVRVQKKDVQTVTVGDSRYENSLMVAVVNGAKLVDQDNYNIPSLDYKQVMSVLKLNIPGVPADETVDEIEIRVTERLFMAAADVELSSGNIVGNYKGKNNKIFCVNKLVAKVEGAKAGVETEVNMSLLPCDIAGRTMTIKVVTSKRPEGGDEKGSKKKKKSKKSSKVSKKGMVKTEYVIETPGMNFQANHIYSISLKLIKPEGNVPKNKISLTANEVFFSTGHSFRNKPIDGAVGRKENQNKVYSHVEGWKTNQDTLIWGIDAIGGGTIDVTPILAVSSDNAGNVIEITLAGETKAITLKSTGGMDDFGHQDVVRFNIPSSGRYVLKMNLQSYSEPKSSAANVQGLNLACGDKLLVKPVIIRWRPSAILAQWRYSGADKFTIVVHDNTAITKDVNMYAPLTTPFGYFGGGWRTAEQQFGGINFSLWSQVNKLGPLPGVEKFSHLIAAGENRRIDGFNHEGTGVKPRSLSGTPGIYENATGKTSQILAMCKVPGFPHDTYYGYYFDLVESKWNLLACGKGINKNKNGALTYMNTGAFIEQPGNADKNRSGHIQREMQYSAWAMDEENKWHSMDRMKAGGGPGGSSYKNWGVKKNDKGHERFFMQMGGFTPILETRAEKIFELEIPAPIPYYLQGDLLKSLIGDGKTFKLPATINLIPATDVTTNSSMLNFDVTDIGTNPEVTLYYGEYDGLTFVEGNKGSGTIDGREGLHWDNILPLANTTNGKINHKITNLKSNTKYYYRLQIINDQGETWSFDTQTFTTK